MRATPPSHDDRIARLCQLLKGQGFFTYAEQAQELNRRGKRTSSGAEWNAQSVYLCCRRHRQRHNGKRATSAQTHDLLDGRWRDQMRTKVLELKSYGVIRYADLAEALNAGGVTTRLGHPWTLQSVLRLMRSIGMPTGKPGRRSRDE
jgi:hypothetical protein